MNKSPTSMNKKNMREPFENMGKLKYSMNNVLIINKRAQYEKLYLLKNATKKMKELGKHIGIMEKNQVIEAGSAKTVILKAAEKYKANLIIVGSHGRHGLQLLLGSTANAVLHGAKCDVLAVRLKE